MSVKTYERKTNIKLSTNFTQDEFDCHCQNLCSKTLIDPELVQRLQRLRTLIGKEIKIESGYRCPTWNAKIGGVKDSNHTKGIAADIYVKGMSPETLAMYAEVVGLREILCYTPEGMFCHVGTRPDKWYAKTSNHGKTFTTVSTFGGTLKKGAGSVILIKKLQTLLNAKGFNCGAIDGDFGTKTDTAVRSYQKSKGLLQDGVVGSVTWQSLGV